jgi:hypothetical protein
MAYDWAKATERKLKKLTREIEEIDRFFYGHDGERDRDSYLSMLERKRDDVVRSVVLQLHTAIEELLTDELYAEILHVPHLEYGRKLHSTIGESLLRMLTGLGFEMKVHFAVVAELLGKKERNQLLELNSLRNKCSHNWLLDVSVKRKGKRGTGPRLLAFRGKDVHKVDVLQDVAREYGYLYYRMLSRRLYRDDRVRAATVRARARQRRQKAKAYSIAKPQSQPPTLPAVVARTLSL